MAQSYPIKRRPLYLNPQKHPLLAPPAPTPPLPIEISPWKVNFLIVFQTKSNYWSKQIKPSFFLLPDPQKWRVKEEK